MSCFFPHPPIYVLMVCPLRMYPRKCRANAFQMSRSSHHPWLDYPNNIYFKAQIEKARYTKLRQYVLLVHVGKKRSLPRICIERTDRARRKGWKTSQDSFCRHFRHAWDFDMIGYSPHHSIRCSTKYTGIFIFQFWSFSLTHFRKMNFSARM